MQRVSLSQECIRGGTTQTIPVYSNTNGRPLSIGPIEVFFHERGGENALWILCHPAISGFVHNEIAKFGCSVTVVDDISLFSVRGEKSYSFMKSLFDVNEAETELKGDHLYASVYSPHIALPPYYAPEYYREDSHIAMPKRRYYPPNASPAIARPHTAVQWIRRNQPQFGRALSGFDVFVPHELIRLFWNDASLAKPVIVTSFLSLHCSARSPSGIFSTPVTVCRCRAFPCRLRVDSPTTSPILPREWTS